MEQSLRRLRLVVEYDGTDFCGFQRQPGKRSVQSVLEAQLAEVCGHPVEIVGSGRTDAGVHSLGQVVHFETRGSIPPGRVAVAMNARIRPELVVRRVEEVGAEFHARYSASRRTYHYYVSREPPTPFAARYALFEHSLLEDAARRMGDAAASLVGTYEFRAFSRPEGRRSTIRTIYRAVVEERRSLLRIELTADSFLRSMVRIITGHLLEIGMGRREPEELRAAREGGGCGSVPATAPAHGLCLVRVEYPDGYPGAVGEPSSGGAVPVRDGRREWDARDAHPPAPGEWIA